MAQSFIQQNTDGVGKKVDTQVTTTAAQHRQVVNIGAKDVDANIAPVDSVNGLGVQVIPALPAGANVIGSVGLVPLTAGGLTIFRLLSAATTNATSVKGSAGQVYGGTIFNAAGSIKYVKFYNKATAPTVGTDTPVMTLPLEAGKQHNITIPVGVSFTTGIAMAITGAVADADTTAVALNDVIVNLYYK